MADLRKETFGPGSMKGVNLAVISYDNRVARDKDDKITTHYLDARIHPGDARGPGQVALALVAKKDPKSPSGYNNSARYSEGQFQSIVEAAGDNVSDLTNVKSEVIGKIYGVKADLIISNGDVIANTKTLTGSDLSVAPDAAGTDIRGQIFESQKVAKDARTAANEAKAAEAGVEAGAEAPVAAGVDFDALLAAQAAANAAVLAATPAAAPAAPAAAPKAKAAARKPKAVKPELVSVGAETTQASSDEPELG